MFIVKKVTTLERYCPNGHESLSTLFPETNHSIRFCHICGASIEEGQETCDAAYCSGCGSPVSPSWNYCPYCGQGR